MRILAVLSLALVVAGCVEYEEEIVVEADGGGRMTISYAAPTSAVTLLETFAPAAAAQGIDVPLSFSEDSIRKVFDDPAVSDLAVDVDRGEKRCEVKVSFAFSNAADLAGKAFLGGGACDFDQKAMTLRRTWTSPLAVAEAMGGEKSPMIEMARTRIAEATAGANAKFTVRLPGREPITTEVPIAEIADKGLDLTLPLPPAAAKRRLLAALDDLAARIGKEGASFAARIRDAESEEARAAVRAEAAARLAEFRAELAALRARGAASAPENR